MAAKHRFIHLYCHFSGAKVCVWDSVESCQVGKEGKDGGTMDETGKKKKTATLGGVLIAAGAQVSPGVHRQRPICASV